LNRSNRRSNIEPRPSKTKQFDGSKRHVLDWIKSAGCLDTARDWTRAQGFEIAPDAAQMPKSWTEPGESRLFNATSPFLDEINKSELRAWWAHAGSANIPNWDLIIKATADNRPALLLVEAKAHANEFDCKGKARTLGKAWDSQTRTDENHDRIGLAIEEASIALSHAYPGISISRDRCYQLSNRIAMAWKLASIGVPSTLVFLGFTGDSEIAKAGSYFADDAHWQLAFDSYASSSIPQKYLDRELSAGAASFRVIARSVPVARLSRPLSERRGTS
jgi:hypothetical protein